MSLTYSHMSKFKSLFVITKIIFDDFTNLLSDCPELLIKDQSVIGSVDQDAEQQSMKIIQYLSKFYSEKVNTALNIIDNDEEFYSNNMVPLELEDSLILLHYIGHCSGFIATIQTMNLQEIFPCCDMLKEKFESLGSKLKEHIDNICNIHNSPEIVANVDRSRPNSPSRISYGLFDESRSPSPKRHSSFLPVNDEHKQTTSNRKTN